MTDKEYKQELKKLSAKCDELIDLANENEKIINEGLKSAQEAYDLVDEVMKR